MWVNLYSANKEYAFVPVFDVVKTMTGIAERLSPTYDSIVPAKGRHGQGVYVGNIHLRSKKNQLHIRAMHEMR